MNSNNSKPELTEDDDMLDEYDFSNGVRGKYTKRLQEAEEITIKINKQKDNDRSERVSVWRIVLLLGWISVQ